MSQYQSVVFFDLDGTLIVNPFDSAVWPVILGEIAEKSGASTETVFGTIIEENVKRQNDTAISPVLSMDWDDIVQTVAAGFGVQLDASCEALVCANAASHSSLLDHAVDVLHELNAPHRALVVATKGLAKYQQPVLDALSLTSLFHSVITPDTHSSLKKHVAFFGDWPSTTRLQIMVGDRYDDDVLGPGGHGFKTIWKPVTDNPTFPKKDPFARAMLHDYTAQQTIPADAIIHSLDELPAVVRRLEHAVLGFSDK
jgi:FMN phosphatase YigB (HAD superfamily)